MRLFVILISLFICYAIVVLSLIIYYALKKPHTNGKVIIVLGCKVKGNQPSKSLKRRLDSAYLFLEKNKNIICVVSGGKGSDELISEAECMYRYLVQRGISPKRIIKEDKSTNTYENLMYSFDISNSQKLNSGVIIATDFYHHLRANIIAKKNKLEIVGAISSIPPFKTFIFNTIRELVAIPHEILKQFIFNIK